MQIDACYAAFGGNYEDVKSRLMKDDLIKRLVIKFLADTSYERLAEAVAQKNHGDAFRAVHTLKGVSQNLSFDRLSQATEGLTETLRKWETIPVDEALCEAQFEQVTAEYQAVIGAIRQLQDAE
ncbi:MAG: Hpt domain-containing protein [bacterium]|nr:Hpt domain-containing protein [bacterium]MDY4100681.1 Hpt domain-containing protein [Lachnospiraceae bacterium]